MDDKQNTLDQILSELISIQEQIKSQDEKMNMIIESLSLKSPPDWFVKEGHLKEIESVVKHNTLGSDDFWKVLSVTLKLMKKNGFVKGFR